MAGLRGRGGGSREVGRSGQASVPTPLRSFRLKKKKKMEKEKKGEVSFIKYYAMQSRFLTYHQNKASSRVINVSFPHFCRTTIKKKARGSLNDVSNIEREGRPTSKLI